MRYFYLAIFLFSFSHLHAQKGYVITFDDSVHSGYLKRIISFIDGKAQFEIWKTKTDKNPVRYPFDMVKEYALKKTRLLLLEILLPDWEKKSFSIQ